MLEKLSYLPETYSVTRRYLVAVSGGCDSVVLLYLLHALGYRKLIVVHLNHRLRGRASGADAAFVRRLAKKLGYDIDATSRDVGKKAQRSKQSIETAGRQERYAFFVEVAKRRRCSQVFLAHHADDQVETILMNLFRGSGLSGLGGMSCTSETTVNGRRLTLIRPLLDMWRIELESYAQTHGIAYREDASNADSVYLRNRIRHGLIPQIQQLTGRDARAAIHRLGQQAQAENRFMENQIAVLAEEETISVAKLRALPLALQRRLVYRWLRRREVADVNFELVQNALTLIEEPASTAKINLPKDRYLRRRRGRLFVWDKNG